MRTFPEFVFIARQRPVKEFRTGDLKLAQRFVNKFFRIDPPLDIRVIDGFPLNEYNHVPESEIWLIDIQGKVAAIFKMTPL